MDSPGVTSTKKESVPLVRPNTAHINICIQMSKYNFTHAYVSIYFKKHIFLFFCAQVSLNTNKVHILVLG